MKRLVPLGLLLSGLGCDGNREVTTLEPVNAGINVLLITIDTLRADHMSSYGYRRDTSPNIDELASNGVLFETTFTYWPKTRGSFATLFTGLYASQHGLTVRDRDLPDFNRTLAETLRDAGYRTAAAIDNGNLDEALGFAQGFDLYEQTWLTGETELARTEAITEFGERFLTATGEERPFFLWLHYVNPHTPYDPPEDYLSRFRGDGLIPRGPELEKVVGFHDGVNRHVAVEGETHWGDYVDRYDAEILVADAYVGRILDALEASPHAGTTLVVFTSDHGESLGEHGYYFDHGFDLYNPSLWIPLIMSFPGILPAGERVSGAISSLDIYPTILDLAQVSFPPELEGSSALPVIRGTSARLHDEIYFQNDRHLLGTTNGRLKLVHYPETEQQPDHYRLYDMYRDPAEEDDRYPGSGASIAPFQAQLSSFRTRTVAWQQATTAKRAGPATDDSQLPAETLRNLESLGYINK